MVLDAGGVDLPIPSQLAAVVDILSPNETELARLTNMPTENFEEISQAARKCHEMVILEIFCPRMFQIFTFKIRWISWSVVNGKLHMSDSRKAVNVLMLLNNYN